MQLNMAKILLNDHQLPQMCTREESGVAESLGGCRSVEFVRWCVMDLVIIQS